MPDRIKFRAKLPEAKNAIQLGGDGDVRIMLDVHIEDGLNALELFRQYLGTAFCVEIYEDEEAEYE